MGKDAMSLQSKTAPFARSTIIIADPNDSETAVTRKILSAQGFEVLIGHTLADIIGLLSQCTPDYVITELKFPDGNGVDLVRHCKDKKPAARVVVRTWYADIAIAVAATKAGADDFVPKPVADEFLLNILLYGSKNIPLDCRIEDPAKVRREHIEEVLRSCKSNVSMAARRLRLNRRSLQRMLRRYEEPALV